MFHKPGTIRFITLDPGHFHAALVQKTMYKGVDPSVFIYSPEGADLNSYLNMIDQYNNRDVQPTRWNINLYTKSDFFEKMLSEKEGNVVILAGNNRNKTKYIYRSIENGFHVLADKPMAINKNDFELLRKAFALAEENDLLLCDIMTERFEITNILQKELSRIPEIFGTLQKGSPENPAVTMESVHHFYKYVSGKALKRPPWFFDTEQEGEGLTDVATHLVDLIQWVCFPDLKPDYKTDVRIHSADRWITPITRKEFCEFTETDKFPDYLLKDVVNDSIINIYCNGEINYQLNGVYVRVCVRWDYKAPDGCGDTHHSLIRGTNASLEIRQGQEQHFKPVLYIVPENEKPGYETILAEQFKALSGKYPGIELIKRENEWEIVVPDKYRDGHESHFACVTEKFIGSLQDKSIPEWEVPNMLTKYYITTGALKLTRSKN